jgi:hypothetical protein
MIKQYNIELNKHKLELLLDIDKEHWYVFFPKYGQYTSGSFNDNGLERIHHPITVGSRNYELVLDPNDQLTEWESFSVFDCKKQCYIDTAQGKI